MKLLKNNTAWTPGKALPVLICWTWRTQKQLWSTLEKNHKALYWMANNDTLRENQNQQKYLWQIKRKNFWRNKMTPNNLEKTHKPFFFPNIHSHPHIMRLHVLLSESLSQRYALKRNRSPKSFENFPLTLIICLSLNLPYLFHSNLPLSFRKDVAQWNILQSSSVMWKNAY